MGLTTPQDNANNTNNNNNNAPASAPPQDSPYVVESFGTEYLTIKSATPGVFKINRNVQQWLIPGADIYFNEAYDQFTVRFSNAESIATARNFIMKKPGLFMNQEYILQNLPQHKPIATFNVNLEATAPPPEYTPPAVVDDNNKIDLEKEFFAPATLVDKKTSSSLTSAPLTTSYGDTASRSNNSSPEVKSKFPEELKTNQEKLKFILAHPGLGQNDTEIKEAQGAINKHIETMCYECPLSREIMNNPVILPHSGKSVDEESAHSLCFKNNAYIDLYAENKPFSLPLTKNRDLATGIAEYLDAKLTELDNVVKLKTVNSLKS